jgi:hypothetical protein
MNQQQPKPLNQQQPKPYALCHGEELEVCESCIRNVDRHEAVADYQQHLKPTVNERGQCADWRPQ